VRGESDGRSRQLAPAPPYQRKPNLALAAWAAVLGLLVLFPGLSSAGDKVPPGYHIAPIIQNNGGGPVGLRHHYVLDLTLGQPMQSHDDHQVHGRAVGFRLSQTLQCAGKAGGHPCPGVIGGGGASSRFPTPGIGQRGLSLPPGNSRWGADQAVDVVEMTSPANPGGFWVDAR